MSNLSTRFGIEPVVLLHIKWDEFATTKHASSVVDGYASDIIEGGNVASTFRGDTFAEQTEMQFKLADSNDRLLRYYRRKDFMRATATVYLADKRNLNNIVTLGTGNLTGPVTYSYNEKSLAFTILTRLKGRPVASKFPVIYGSVVRQKIPRYTNKIVTTSRIYFSDGVPSEDILGPEREGYVSEIEPLFVVGRQYTVYINRMKCRVTFSKEATGKYKVTIHEGNLYNFDIVNLAERRNDPDYGNPAVFWVYGDNDDVPNQWLEGLYAQFRVSGMNSSKDGYFGKIVKQVGTKCYLETPDGGEIDRFRGVPNNSYGTLPLQQNIFIRRVAYVPKREWFVGRIRDRLKFPWYIPEGSIITPYPGESFGIKYIVAGHPLTSFHEVMAVRKVKGTDQLVPVPKKYYEKYLNNNTEGIPSAFIKFLTPLEGREGENWRDDYIYVSCRSPKSKNAATILKDLFENYTDFTVHLPSYEAVRDSVEGYHCSFMVAEEIDAMELIAKIASQALIGYRIVNGVVFFYDLTIRPNSSLTLNNSTILATKPYMSTLRDETELTRTLTYNWRFDGYEEEPRKVVLDGGDGDEETNVDILIYNDEKLVKRSAEWHFKHQAKNHPIVKLSVALNGAALNLFSAVTYEGNRCQLVSWKFDASDYTVELELYATQTDMWRASDPRPIADPNDGRTETDYVIEPEINGFVQVDKYV